MMQNQNRRKISKRSIYGLFSIGFFLGSTTFALDISSIQNLLGGTTNTQGSFSTDYDNKLDGLIDPINQIVDHTETDKSLFTNTINQFCTSMTSGNPMAYSGILYNAKNSIFMYRLCTDNDKDKVVNISRGPGLSNKEETSYVAFQQMSDGSKIDALQSQLPSLFNKTNKYIEDLFDTIAQSYTSVYQASIYGKKGDNTTPNEQLITEFSKLYFYGSDVISICAKDKDYKYPQTCKKMTSYLNDATNSLKSSTNILNLALIYKDQEKANCDITKADYNTISCGLYGGDMTKFVNLVYNELFYYASFVQYYTYILETQPQFKANVTQNTLEQAQAKQNEIGTMRQNLSDSRKAITTSIRFLKELKMTFPMHIGLLMYTEAINTFVQSFNKTLIPVYTLGDIFRNVQDTK